MHKNKVSKAVRLLLAVVLVIGLIPIQAFADQLYSNGELTTYFQRHTGSAWVDYVQKDYRIGDAGDIAYCLEGGKHFSESFQDTWSDKGVVVWAMDNFGIPFRSGMDGEKYYEGLKYILFWGYPNFIPDGLTAEQAHYATSAAIHWYSAWATGQNYTDNTKYGYSFWGECFPTANYSTGGIARMRPKSGVEGAENVYYIASVLYEEAIAGNRVDPYKSAELYKTNDSQQVGDDGAVLAVEESGAYVSYVTFNTRGAQQRPYEYEVSGVAGATVEEILPIRTENNLFSTAGHPAGAHVWVDLKVTIPISAENSDKIATVTAKGRCPISDTSIAFSMPESTYQSTISALIFAGTRYEEVSAQINIKTPEAKKTVTITKDSSDPNLTPDNNNLYTYDGTSFGIYNSQSDAENKENAVEILTLTGGAASVTSSPLPVGSYWVRELETSACYYVNEDVYKVDGADDANGSKTIANEPKTDPASTLVIGKVDFSGQDKPITWSPAIFKIEYFDNYECSGDPLRTWYYKTNAEGMMDMGDPALLISEDPYISSEAYTNELGQVTIPLGSVIVTEVQAPSGYEVGTGSAKGTITLINGLAAFRWEEGTQGIFANDIVGGVESGLDYLVIGNKSTYHRVQVLKNEGQKQGNTSMAGIVLSVTNTSGHTVYVKTGEDTSEAIADGEMVTSIQLDDRGYGSTEAILPYGKYTLKEVSVPDGSGLILNSSWSEEIVIDENYSDEYVAEFSNETKVYGVKGVKLDSDRNDAVPSGDATLMGAEISVINRSANAVKVGGTWYEPGKVVTIMTTAADGSFSTVSPILPYGTYELKETKAPTGYMLNTGWSYTFTISSADANRKIFEVPEDKALKNEPLKEKIVVIKWDKDRGVGTLGPVNPKSALEGIQFEVINRSNYPVVYGGQVIQPGGVITTITSAYDDATQTYRAETGDLPYGRYDIRELYEDGAENLRANHYYLVDNNEAVLAELHDLAEVTERTVTLNFADTRINRLAVTKTVTGNMGNKEKDFSFELSIGDNRGVPVRFEKTNADGNKSSGVATLTGGKYSFTLRHGEQIVFDYIIGGNTYSVIELDGESDGYEVTYDGESSGTLGLDTTVEVKNTRQSIIPTGAFVSSSLAGAGILAAGAITIIVLKTRKKEQDE